MTWRKKTFLKEKKKSEIWPQWSDEGEMGRKYFIKIFQSRKGQKRFFFLNLKVEDRKDFIKLSQSGEGQKRIYKNISKWRTGKIL